ncbi:MAG TPA: prepilin peptidase [Micromonosporaceae bacterium]|nr:prepilin peptidase [Micromonosporaceae bacterium]
MSAVLAGACAVAGGVLGASVPQVAYRLSVPYGAPPRPGCAACARPFAPGLSGWVRLTARCPGCRARTGPPAVLTGLAAAVACGLLGWAVPAPVLPAFLAVAVLGVLLAAIDLACLRLPDRLVGTAAAASLAGLGTAALAGAGLGTLGRALAGAGALGGAYLVLALLPGGGLGFGDVKLAAVLGLLLGWLGWGAVLLGAVLPHVINGPVAVGLLILGRAGRRTALPLGPALLAGALFAVVATQRRLF